MFSHQSTLNCPKMGKSKQTLKKLTNLLKAEVKCCINVYITATFSLYVRYSENCELLQGAKQDVCYEYEGKNQSLSSTQAPGLTGPRLNFSHRY